MALLNSVTFNINTVNLGWGELEARGNWGGRIEDRPWKKITRLRYMGIENICQHFFSATIYQDLEEKSVWDLTLKSVSKRKTRTIPHGKVNVLGPEDHTVHRVLACWEWRADTGPCVRGEAWTAGTCLHGSDRWLTGNSARGVLDLPPSQALPPLHSRLPGEKKWLPCSTPVAKVWVLPRPSLHPS